MIAIVCQEVYSYRIINLTIVECKSILQAKTRREGLHNKSNHSGM